MSPRHNLSFCACKTAWFALEWQVYMGSSPHLCVFSMQNSDFVTRHTSLCGSQISSVVLSTHNHVLSTRLKRLYGFQPSPVALCMQNSNFSTWITSLYGSQPSSEVFACKPAAFGPKLHVSMGPSPHLRFLHAKQRVLAQNYRSLWVPDLTCPFVQSKRVICTRISSLYWFQPSSVVLCLQNSDFWTGITSL